jgi:hypothetical protein
VRAAVRTADAVDRIHGRENDQHQDGGKPAHPSIICGVPIVVRLSNPLERRGNSGVKRASSGLVIQASSDIPARIMRP